ncbi:hypothetical protein HDU96_004520 [Phlyctochytrium bullatum]|nr:hypothetical protein HDU96_004520 [Phlyctochytrium bullatum]
MDPIELIRLFSRIAPPAPPEEQVADDQHVADVAQSDITSDLSSTAQSLQDASDRCRNGRLENVEAWRAAVAAFNQVLGDANVAPDAHGAQAFRAAPAASSSAESGIDLQQVGPAAMIAHVAVAAEPTVPVVVSDSYPTSDAGSMEATDLSNVTAVAEVLPAGPQANLDVHHPFLADSYPTSEDEDFPEIGPNVFIADIAAELPVEPVEDLEFPGLSHADEASDATTVADFPEVVLVAPADEPPLGPREDLEFPGLFHADEASDATTVADFPEAEPGVMIALVAPADEPPLGPHEEYVENCGVGKYALLTPTLAIFSFDFHGLSHADEASDATSVADFPEVPGAMIAPVAPADEPPLGIHIHLDVHGPGEAAPIEAEFQQAGPGPMIPMIPLAAFAVPLGIHINLPNDVPGAAGYLPTPNDSVAASPASSVDWEIMAWGGEEAIDPLPTSPATTIDTEIWGWGGEGAGASSLPTPPPEEVGAWNNIVIGLPGPVINNAEPAAGISVNGPEVVHPASTSTAANGTNATGIALSSEASVESVGPVENLGQLKRKLGLTEGAGDYSEGRDSKRRRLNESAPSYGDNEGASGSSSNTAGPLSEHNVAQCGGLTRTGVTAADVKGKGKALFFDWEIGGVSGARGSSSSSSMDGTGATMNTTIETSAPSNLAQALGRTVSSPKRKRDDEDEGGRSSVEDSLGTEACDPNLSEAETDEDPASEPAGARSEKRRKVDDLPPKR